MSKISPLYSDIKLNCVITSDNHIDVKHPMPWLPPFRLNCSLKDSQSSKVPMDAYITVGDTTSRSSPENWSLTKKCFAKYTPAKNILLTIGNHDTWNDDGSEAAIKEYLRNSNEICGTKHEKPYFSTEINGYSFIFLGSVEDNGCEANLGNEQLDWFAEKMAAADASKPVFVFCHQSLNCRHGLPKTWDDTDECTDPFDGGIGSESDAVEKILKSRKNVYYFSGHSHMGLCGENSMRKNGFASFEQEDDLTLINLPSLACGNHHGEDRAMCIGVVLEAYADRVVIRPRNFKLHTMNKQVIIKDGKPYFEKIFTEK